MKENKALFKQYLIEIYNCKDWDNHIKNIYEKVDGMKELTAGIISLQTIPTVVER